MMNDDDVIMKMNYDHFGRNADGDCDCDGHDDSDYDDDADDDYE